MKRIPAIISTAILAATAFLPAFVLAQSVNPQTEFQKAYGGVVNTSLSPAEVAGRYINTAVTYVGVIILALVVYAGFLWVTAAGNEEKISKAKKILVGSILGLVIIFSASAIVNFIVNRLAQTLK